MSLTGALSSAISGLSAQSQALAMVSDDLANASTVGYKTNSAMFDDLVTNAMNATQYSSGGVSVSTRANISQQGLLTTTKNPTDVAIEGQGFFVVSNSTVGGTISYTRDGDFTPDQNGFLENNGSFLLGERTDAAGNLLSGALEPINTDVVPTNSSPTTKVSIPANLPSDAAAGATFQNSIPIYDSQGNASTIEITWTKSATPADTWTGTYGNPTSAANPSQQTGTASGTITVSFNASDGSLASATQSTPALSVTWNNGAAPSSIAVNLGTINGTDGLTQHASGTSPPSITVGNVTADGVPFGELNGVSVGNNGVVEASYTNGQTIPIYKIPVATFPDPDALQTLSDGLYEPTVGSGPRTLQFSGQGAAGTIFGSKLESSATDTNQEFSTMMTAQQAYSASAQVVTAVNKMFDTLISAMR
jgi:flagellar hook protein FlgE